MKSPRSGAIKPGELGLSCKANKCNDAGTGDLGVLPTHETPLMEMSFESHLCYNEQLGCTTGSTKVIKLGDTYKNGCPKTEEPINLPAGHITRKNGSSYNKSTMVEGARACTHTQA